MERVHASEEAASLLREFWRSEHVLKNQDPYLTVLETALSVQSRLRNAPPKSIEGNAEVAQALSQLTLTIQTKLLKPLSYVQNDDGSAVSCDILLSPNPWEKWHARM